MEKQSNGELTEVVKKQRRIAAKQDAEAAGREYKHQDEVQQLRKVGSCTKHVMICACMQVTCVWLNTVF